MNKWLSSVCVALVLAAMLGFSVALHAQDAQQDQGEPQSAVTPGDSEVETAPSTAPETAAEHPAAKKAAVHHKHKKKKTAHKPAKKKPHHARKRVKKSKAKPHHKVAKKATTHKAKAVARPKAKEVEQAPLQAVPVPTPGETEKEITEKKEVETPPLNEAAEPQKTAPAPVEKKKTVAPAEKKASRKAAAATAAAEPKKAKAAANGSGKSVTYTFCLGYDNCTPYRYEAMVHGGTVDAKIFKEAPDEGGWKEAGIDPVMASDLGAMARTESGSDVLRPLTVTEKARIADHQGKAHAELVAAAEGGPEHKEEFKRMMHDLGIKNADDLVAYDPRMAKNDAALQAASELNASH